MLSYISIMDHEVDYFLQSLTVAQVHFGIEIAFRSRTHTIARTPRSGGSGSILFVARPVLRPIIVLNFLNWRYKFLNLQKANKILNNADISAENDKKTTLII